MINAIIVFTVGVVAGGMLIELFKGGKYSENVRQAVDAEREACAAIAEQWPVTRDTNGRVVGKEIAKAIRSQIAEDPRLR